MAVLSLPLSFTNSFWSQDYRKGLEVLLNKLEQGVAENDQVVAFIRARIVAESQMAAALMSPMLAGTQGVGFAADDGASLLMTFRGLESESVAQGQMHKNIAKELETLVVDPFDDWAQGYKARLGQTRHAVLDTWMKTYEQAQGDVAKLKHQYLSKVRKADEAEDDAKFAPNSNGVTDTYTTSPRIRPTDAHRTPPQRTASVSERIAQRLKEIQKKSAGALSGASSSPAVTVVESPIDEKTPKIDKGKGKEVLSSSPPPLSPLLPPSKLEGRASPMPPFPAPPMVLAGLSLPPSAVSQLLTKAATDLNLRPIRVPLLGEYQDCFNGEEFVAWLKDNVDGFGGSLDRAEDAAKELTERDGLLRRIGEFGNQFEHSDDAFYQFRAKAFDIERKNSDTITSPVKTMNTENLFKRTNTLLGVVSKALSTSQSEPPYIKARNEAEEADKTYRLAMRRLDRQRLGLEERLEETLKTLQRWELERLRAIKTVLLQYQGTVSNLPKSLEPSVERSSTLIAAFQPESDLNALIERYRTGPFRPEAQVYESVSHDESDVVFGIDLRKWSEGGWSVTAPAEEKKDPIPAVVHVLLTGLAQSYNKLPEDAEKRKSWIYEVPLQASHHLREALNAIPPEEPIPGDIMEKYDAPVIASTIKLWLLELDPPIALYEGWDEFRKLYPTVGASKAEGEASEEERLKSLSSALQKLPRVHLYVLDVIIRHIKQLIGTTKVEESDEVFITKLALSIGRTILRPKFETELSIQDRHPTLLFIDLIKHYDAILPPTIARKKRESERAIPLRKRTALVDMRTSRSRISIGGASQMFGNAQQKMLSPELKAPVTLPPVPPMPDFKNRSPPPPPVIEEPEHIAEEQAVPPAPPVVASPIDDLPARPSFKEPATDDDDLPPRPAFKEPPPENDDDSPPRPAFADPPPEEEEIPSPGIITSAPHKGASTPIPSELTSVAHKRTSSISSRSASPRSPSPKDPETPKSTISRSSSGGVRGPRVARGPRQQSGNVSALVSNLNRHSSTGSPPASPNMKRLSASPSRRPSSVLGRSAANTSFSRRTMGSDAEDDVVGKK